MRRWRPSGASSNPALSPVDPTQDLPPRAERPGATIGRYKLLQEIGEGGFGVVYMAEQREPVRRKVALKIIKPGMDTRAVVARFESERQALALMDHPNIAHVFDAGATDSGRPYFVMELVHGVALTEYCDQGQLTTRERLELFVQVCHAVQHAHQKGIIHRDLKPSNVMVTLYDGVPVPKIIDFGVAKATGGQLTEKTAFTGYGQMIGTPLYMSPEQAAIERPGRGHPQRHLLAGRALVRAVDGQHALRRPTGAGSGLRRDPPHDPRGGAAAAQHPDQHVGRRGHDDLGPPQDGPGQAQPPAPPPVGLDCDEGPGEGPHAALSDGQRFARDIERYLNDEPIEARPPTLAGRAARWARRHRPLVWASAAVLGIAVAGSLVSALLIAGAYEREKTQRVVAETNEVRALTGEQLAKQQEELAKQQEALAKEQQKIAIQQKAEAERQRDAAETALYAANMQVARQDWTAGRAHRLQHVLDAQLPKPGRPDFRGWEWYYLFSLCHAERWALPCQCPFGWSPDGKYLATADYIGLLNIWDVANGERKASLNGCPPFAHCQSISWSPDGKHIAAGTDRGTVMIWEVASGTRVRSLMGGGAVASLVDWNPDGRRLASGEDDGTISIWDGRTGKKLSSLVGPAGPVHSLDWHPDGRQLVAVYGPRDTRELKIWDTDSGREIAGWRTDGGPTAAFSPDGSRLLWGINPVRVTDLKTHKVVSSLPGMELFHASWNPIGDRLASTSYGGSLKIWDAARGAELWSIPAALRQTMPIAWNPNEELLAAWSHSDGTLRVWDIAIPQNALSFDTPPASVRFLWVAFSPDGKRLLVGAQDEIPRMYDVESGVVTISGQHRLGWLRRASWSPDGKRYAINACVASPAWTVLVCDGQSGEPVLPPLRCDGRPLSLAWKPDGSALAVGLMRDESTGSSSYRGQVKLFSASTGEELAASALVNAEKFDGTAESVAWSPDGQRLAVAGVPLRVLDSSLHPLPFAATAASNCMDWSPDGRQLATGSKEGTVTILDWATGMPLHILEGHGYVDAIHWHPWMPRLASGGRDGMIRIWDTATGQELFAMDGQTNIVRDLDWSPDGWRLATTGCDGSVRILDASPAHRFFKRHARPSCPGLETRRRILCSVPQGCDERRVSGSPRPAEAAPHAASRREGTGMADSARRVAPGKATRAGWSHRRGDRDLPTVDRPVAGSARLPAPTAGGAVRCGMGDSGPSRCLRRRWPSSPSSLSITRSWRILYERRAIQLCLGERLAQRGSPSSASWPASFPRDQDIARNSSGN